MINGIDLSIFQERPNRPLEVGDIVVIHPGIRCQVVSLTPQEQGNTFRMVHVGLKALPPEEEA